MCKRKRRGLKVGVLSAFKYPERQIRPLLSLNDERMFQMTNTSSKTIRSTQLRVVMEMVMVGTEREYQTSQNALFKLETRLLPVYG